MTTWKPAMVTALSVSLLTLSTAWAQTPSTKASAKAMTLTGQDYAEIQQLAARYMFLVDGCTNGGYDFADLFAADGWFSISQEWGVATGRKYTGRDALAEAAGGGPSGCKDPKDLMGYGISHFTVNHMITPTPEGAIGKSYVLAIWAAVDPIKVERQGGYEDIYVKTAAGWRFKSRVHVFPNMAQSIQFRGRGAAPPSPLAR